MSSTAAENVRVTVNIKKVRKRGLFGLRWKTEEIWNYSTGINEDLKETCIWLLSKYYIGLREFFLNYVINFGIL